MPKSESIVHCPFCRIPVTTAGGWPFVASMLLIHFEKCTPTMSDGERRNESARLASAHMASLASVARPASIHRRCCAPPSVRASRCS